MKKVFLFSFALFVALPSYLFSCNNNDDEYNENNKNEANPVVCNVSISSDGNGRASFKGYTEASIAVTSGTNVTISAIPDDGYEFVGWCAGESASPVNLGLNYTFNVSADIALIAVFEKEENQEEVFSVVEQLPEFPGGTTDLMAYLRENIIYPKISRENNSQGRPFVRFIVNADGSITDAMLLRSAGDIYLDMEAVRVISAMPNWTPGKQAGEPVRAYYTLPVNFRLQ